MHYWASSPEFLVQWVWVGYIQQIVFLIHIRALFLSQGLHLRIISLIQCSLWEFVLWGHLTIAGDALLSQLGVVTSHGQKTRMLLNTLQCTKHQLSQQFNNYPIPMSSLLRLRAIGLVAFLWNKKFGGWESPFLAAGAHSLFI